MEQPGLAGARLMKLTKQTHKAVVGSGLFEDLQCESTLRCIELRTVRDYD